MKNEDKKPSESSTPSSGPYEDLYGKPLTKEEAAVMHFNLVNFAETLIAMDRQKQAWDKKKTSQKEKHKRMGCAVTVQSSTTNFKH